MSLRHRITAALFHSEGVKLADGTRVMPEPGSAIQVFIGAQAGPARIPHSTPLGGARPRDPVQDVVLAARARRLDAALRREEAPGPYLAPGDQHQLRRVLGRMGVPAETVAPLTGLPEADPSIASSVLQHARTRRDPADYLRLLSHDEDVNALARTAILPALLMNDALAEPGRGGSASRDQIIRVLMNLQLPAQMPA